MPLTTTKKQREQEKNIYEGSNKKTGKKEKEDTILCATNNINDVENF